MILDHVDLLVVNSCLPNNSYIFINDTRQSTSRSDRCFVVLVQDVYLHQTELVYVFVTLLLLLLLLLFARSDAPLWANHGNTLLGKERC